MIIDKKPIRSQIMIANTGDTFVKYGLANERGLFFTTSDKNILIDKYKIALTNIRTGLFQRNLIQVLCNNYIIREVIFTADTYTSYRYELQDK